MECSDAEKLLSAYIDGMLDDDDRSKLEEHLDTCASCRDEYRIMCTMIDSCLKLDDINLPNGFEQDLHERLNEEKHYKKRTITQFINRYKALTAAFLILGVSLGMAAGIGLFGGSQKKSASTTQKQEVYNQVENERIMDSQDAEEDAKLGKGAKDVQGSESKSSEKKNNVMLFSAPSSPAPDQENPKEVMDTLNTSGDFTNVNISKAQYDRYSEEIISLIESIGGHQISSEPLQYTIPGGSVDEFVNKMKDSFKIYDIKVTTSGSAIQNNSDESKLEIIENNAVIQINIGE